MDFTVTIQGHDLEYLDDEHVYLVNGVIVPSVTQILKSRYSRKYDHVSKGVLNKAAQAGTAVHEAIERYCKYGEMSELEELRNFIFLQKRYGFEVLDNEVPVILFKDDEPVAAGRLDLVLKMDDEVGGADVKRVSSLDKEYLAYQLNIYRIAYRQSYGVDWKFLKGVHLRESVRKFVDIPINEEIAWELINTFLEDK